MSADQEPTRVETHGVHTHEPPTKRPPMASVKKFIGDALKHQRTAASIEHEVLSSPIFSDAEKASITLLQANQPTKESSFKEESPVW